MSDVDATGAGDRDGTGPGARASLETSSAPDPGDWPRPEFELLVVSTFGGGGVHHYAEEQIDRLADYLSVSAHDMGMPPTGASHRALRGLVLGLVAALRFPLRSRPDAVHVHTSYRFSFYRATPYVLFAAHVWRVPVVVHVHGSSFDEFVATASRPVAALQRLVFDAADDVVVLSAYWHEAVAERAPAEKIRVVPNAVDPASFRADVGAEPPHVVFVSNLFARKGVRELVEAVERLSDRADEPFRVSVAGDGPLADRVEALARAHDHVSYLGYVSEERKRSLLAEGSIYALPTYAEGLPIAMLEGMAGGNAVVTTGVGAIPEVIDDSRGVLVTPGDVEALTDALAELLADPERCRELARNNRHAVEAHYSWDRAVTELLAVYDDYA